MVFSHFNIIFISIINAIFTLKLNVTKNFVNISQSLKYDALNNKSTSHHYFLRNLINSQIQQSELGLYLININLGETKQEFSLILDSGSSYIWVYDNKCVSCKSKNKYIPEKSKTFLRSQENIKINYISGKIEGNLCRDDLYFNQNITISSFYFLLIYESNLEFEIDGIIGLSKGSFNNKFSFLF